MSELSFAQLFRASPNPYMVLDRELRYVAANEAYLRATASTLEGLLGRAVFELFPNDAGDPNNQSRLMLQESLERVLQTGEADVLALIPYRVPTRLDDPDSLEERFWSATHTPILDADGKVAFILQHTVDVTEVERLRQVASRQMEAGVLARAKRVQDENRLLEEARRRLLHLFDQAPSIMCFLRGSDHVFEMTNRAYQEFVGERTLIGLPVREALPEVVKQGFTHLLDRVFTTGEPFVGRGIRVALRRRPEGPEEENYIDFIYQPIRGANREVIGIFVQGHDITEQKRAQTALVERERELRELNDALEQRVSERTRELSEVNRELESFSYSVSHDLRAPLRHITGFAQLLQRRAAPSLDEVARGYLTTISEAAKQGGKLIDELLAFSRMGRAALKKSEVSLAAIFRDVQRELSSDVAERSVHFVMGELPNVHADPGLLRLVVHNLLSNALKYTRTRPEARIEIVAERSNGEVHVSIADNGVGFDMQHADKLFGVFQRLHSAEEFEGTGIGLANVRRIVTRHGGRVWAEAREGEGATFHFTLPEPNESGESEPRDSTPPR